MGRPNLRDQRLRETSAAIAAWKAAHPGREPSTREIAAQLKWSLPYTNRLLADLARRGTPPPSAPAPAEPNAFEQIKVRVLEDWQAIEADGLVPTSSRMAVRLRLSPQQAANAVRSLEADGAITRAAKAPVIAVDGHRCLTPGRNRGRGIKNFGAPAKQGGRRQAGPKAPAGYARRASARWRRWTAEDEAFYRQILAGLPQLTCPSLVGAPSALARDVGGLNPRALSAGLVVGLEDDDEE